MSTIKNIDLQINVINNKLSRLPKHLKKAKQRGQTVAARKMVKEIKNHIPVKADGYGNQKNWKTKKKVGTLKKSVGVIRGLRRTKNTIIGIRAGKKAPNADGWYGRLVEFGNYSFKGTPFWRKATTAAKPIGEAVLRAAARDGFNGFKIENTK
jgi:HK97 gp10 family phage protein